MSTLPPMIRPGADRASLHGADVPRVLTDEAAAPKPKQTTAPTVDINAAITTQVATAFHLSQLQRPLVYPPSDASPFLASYQRRDLLTAAEHRVTRAASRGELTATAAALATGALNWQSEARNQLDSLQKQRHQQLHHGGVDPAKSPKTLKFPSGQIVRHEVPPQHAAAGHGHLAIHGSGVAGHSASRPASAAHHGSDGAHRPSSAARGAGGIAASGQGQPQAGATVGDLERRWFDSQARARHDAIQASRLSMIMSHWREERAQTAAAVEGRIAAKRQPNSLYVPASPIRPDYAKADGSKDRLGRVALVSGSAAQDWSYPPTTAPAGGKAGPAKAGQLASPKAGAGGLSSPRAGKAGAPTGPAFPADLEAAWQMDAKEERRAARAAARSGTAPGGFGGGLLSRQRGPSPLQAGSPSPAMGTEPATLTQGSISSVGSSNGLGSGSVGPVRPHVMGGVPDYSRYSSGSAGDFTDDEDEDDGPRRHGDPMHEVQDHPAPIRLAPRVTVPIVVTRGGIATTGWPGTAGGMGVAGPGSLRGKPMRPGTVPARPGQNTARPKDPSRPRLAEWWEATGRAEALAAAGERQSAEKDRLEAAAAAEAELLAAKKPLTAATLLRPKTAPVAVSGEDSGAGSSGAKAVADATSLVPPAPPVLSVIPALQAQVRAEAAHDADKANQRVERLGLGKVLPAIAVSNALVPGLHPTADELEARRPLSAGAAPVYRLGENPLARQRRIQALRDAALGVGGKKGKKKKK